MINSKTGYSCPNCGAICSEYSLQTVGEPEWFEEPDPHYSWTEIHICQTCETEYTLINGT